ncbi:FUSC family protein [Streptomyces sediminimaris]|uniref:FUSC family protein n=1 Tax=Streptomyces sediminimaris TaxID=3383721 RepID=UPI00399B5153
MAQAVQRACQGPCRERDLAAQALKAALAAWLSWAVAGWWLHAPVAYMAPWMAILLVESTVYQSVAHALQQLVAIAAGTAMATGLILLMHNRIGTMGLVLPIVVLLSSWSRLGRQGIYTATGALFVLTDQKVSVATSGFRIAEAAFGAAVGIAVNALIRPPVYLRNARASLSEAAQETAGILEAPASCLADGEWGEEEANGWHRRALHLKHLVAESRSAVGWSRESLWGNVRRRTLARSFPGKDYDAVILVLEYAAVHTTELTRTLLEAAAEGRQERWSRLPLIRGYADFLTEAAEVMRLYAESGFGAERQEDLQQAAKKMRATVDGLHERMPDGLRSEPQEASAYGTLLLQAQRLAGHLESSARQEPADGDA